jgi:hypothetical protein
MLLLYWLVSLTILLSHHMVDNMSETPLGNLELWDALEVKSLNEQLNINSKISKKNEQDMKELMFSNQRFQT